MVFGFNADEIASSTKDVRIVIDIPNLEIHASSACNLYCKSCSHFSDQRVGNNISLDEISAEMKPWSTRIKPRLFSILGGEPTLNKQLPEILLECRKQWKESQLQLITNGFYLKRHPSLPDILEKTKCNLEVSIHHSGPEYLEKLKPIRELLDQWQNKYKFQLRYRPSSEKWRTTFEGIGPNMIPFTDNDPEESYKICFAKKCPQIFEGKIWKCPQLAYIHLVHRKYELNEEWHKYLSYRPLYPACSNEELKQYFDTKAEPACAMCPSHHRYFQLPSPLEPVIIDKNEC